ncbi:MAG: phage/plasmid primase, P4 family, partial [bacterium]
ESANSSLRESANLDESANSSLRESANLDRETDKTDSPTLYWAREYVRKFGFSIIPVGRDKKPIIEWKEYQTRYPTDEELEAWFSDGKNNIAIVTGPISEIAVIDIDGEEGEESIKQNKLYLPPTPCVKTGKGYHYYFKYQDGVRNFTKRYPGIDLRGEGGYVLAPPSKHPSGAIYEWLIPLDNNISELPEWVLKERKEIKEKEPGWVEKLLEGVKEGQRNDTLARLAGHYFGKKLSFEETKKILLDWNKRNRPPLDEEEVIKTVESIYKTDLKKKPEIKVKEVEEFRSTDFWNSENFVKIYKNKLLHCEGWGCWLIYKDGRWVRDNSNETQGLAKKIILRYYQQASQMEDDKERKELVKHALKSETQRAISSMIELAKSDLAVIPDVFDKEPYIINLKNGTLNLKTMEFWKHRPDDLLTKQMNVEYNPMAICPKWLAFLNKIFNQKQELIEFIQKALGYSLSGDTGEDCLFILYGTGQNGKTTFLRTISEIWGDYAVDTPTETLLTKERDNIPNDIARLRGARLVTSSESQEGRRFNEILIKKLTGRDRITARFLRQEFFEFDPTFKLWIATNHKPVVRENSIAFWRRIRLIPFTIQIPDNEVIHNFEKLLLEERDGILNWALQGYKKWEQERLGIPEEVKKATQEYRGEMDILGEFVEAKCIEGPSTRTTTQDLYELYCSWCEENKEKPIGKVAFSRRLEERGYIPIRIGHKQERGWQGIGIKSSQDETIEVF